MDDDGFTMHSRRQRYSTREPARDRDRATFLREVQKFAGPSEAYDRTHAIRYGKEERLGPNGEHSRRSIEFPPGTDRQKLYARYNASTEPSNVARRAYHKGVEAAKDENHRMTKEEQRYYAVRIFGILLSSFVDMSWESALSRHVPPFRQARLTSKS